MKNKKLVVALAVVLVCIATLFGVLWKFAKPKTVEGSKQITVAVISSDETENKYTIKTDAEYLGDALYEEKLITEEEYETGYYTVVDGVKADYNVDQSWWCVTKDGEMTTVGMNEQPIADGDKFEITYTIG